MHAIRRGFAYLRPYRSKLIYLIAINLLNAFADLIPAYAYKIILDRIFLLKADPEAFIGILYLIIILFSVETMQSVLDWTQAYYAYKWRQIIKFDLMEDTVRSFYFTSQSFMQNKTVGKLLEKLNNGLSSLLQVYFEYPMDVLAPIVTALLSLTVLTTVDYRIGLILLISAPIYTYFQFRSIRIIREHQPNYREMTEQARGRMVESLYSLENAKVNSNIKTILSPVHKTLDKGLSIYVEMIRGTHFWGSVSRIIYNISFTSTLILTIYLILTGEVTPGMFALVMSLSSKILNPVRRILRTVTYLQQSIVDIDRFFEVIDAPKEYDQFNNLITSGEIQGKVEFKKVYFNYEEDKNVLRGISFSVEPDKTVALVGPSGSGKTTVTKLISGLFVADKGEVLIDDQPITDYSLEYLRKNIAIVFQDPFVFSDTIKNNLKFVKPTATNKEIDKVIKMANLDRFIKSLPKGLQTEVGERGVKLSGGQKQRLAIAQAFLQDAPILIFDEATSSLDAESERLIQEAMQRLMHGRTTFIISHRLATVVHSDRIFVIEKGKIIQEGTHHDLKHEEGLYNYLYTLQTTDPEKLAELELA